jgi:hypothetical protein
LAKKRNNLFRPHNFFQRDETQNSLKGKAVSPVPKDVDQKELQIIKNLYINKFYEEFTKKNRG